MGLLFKWLKWIQAFLPDFSPDDILRPLSRAYLLKPSAGRTNCGRNLTDLQAKATVLPEPNSQIWVLTNPCDCLFHQGNNQGSPWQVISVVALLGLRPPTRNQVLLLPSMETFLWNQPFPGVADFPSISFTSERHKVFYMLKEITLPMFKQKHGNLLTTHSNIAQHLLSSNERKKS